MRAAFFFLHGLVLCLFGAWASAHAEDRALLIGVDRYPYMGPRAQLAGSLNDMRLVHRVAVELWGFKPRQIKMLSNDEATAEGIRQAIRTWLIEGTRPGDRVLLTYSGHGYWQSDSNGDEKDGRDETLAPYDTRWQRDRYINMVVDDELSAFLDQLAGRQVMIVTDACYSGTVTRALDDHPGGPAMARLLTRPTSFRGASPTRRATMRGDAALIASRPNVMVWSAASASELAYVDLDHGGGARGVFTGAFVDGLLRGAADRDGNGAITPIELLSFARERARKFCLVNGCKTSMTPTLELANDQLGLDLSRWGRAKGLARIGAANTIAGLATHSAFKVTAGLSTGRRAHIGDELRVTVTSSRPGYVIVLDVRENGEVVQLFPSEASKRRHRRLRANHPLSLPDATYGIGFVAAKAERGKIIAIVTEDNVSLDGLVAKTRDLSIVPNPKAYLATILQSLMKVWTGDRQNRPVRWGLAVADYEIR